MSTPAYDLDALRDAAGLGVPWADLADLAGVEPDSLTRWWRAVNEIPEPHPPPPHDSRSPEQRMIDGLAAEKLPTPPPPDPLPPPKLAAGDESRARAVVGAIIEGRREAREQLLRRQRELVDGKPAPGVAAMLQAIQQQLDRL